MTRRADDAWTAQWFISILLVASCTVAAVWALTIGHLRHEEEQAVREAENVHAHLAAALEDQAVRTIGSVEQTLNSIVREYRHHGQALDLPELLSDLPGDAHAYSAIALADSDGQMVGAERRRASERIRS